MPLAAPAPAPAALLVSFRDLLARAVAAYAALERFLLVPAIQDALRFPRETIKAEPALAAITLALRGPTVLRGPLPRSLAMLANTVL